MTDRIEETDASERLLVALHDVQYDGVVGRPVQRGTAIPVVTADELLARLPESLRGHVTAGWLRRNVPGAIKVGRRVVWPEEVALAFFAGAPQLRAAEPVAGMVP